MPIFRRRVLGVVFATLVSGLPTTLSGSVVVPLSLAQLTESADVIADATVVDVRTAQGPKGVERLVQVRVANTWKGPEASTLYVRLAGGRLGGTETRLPGVPVVADGDRVIWFLLTHPRGGYSVLGLHQGALLALAAPDGTARVLAPSLLPSSRGSVTRVPRRIDDLAADVRALVDAGGAR
jgi:hypothetical protein